MKIIFYLNLALLMFLSACDGNKVYRKFAPSFDNYQWKTSKEIEFNPTIEDPELLYNIYVAVRHIYGFPYREINVELKMITPSGKEEVFDFPVTFIDNNGKYLSDCAGDYCDREEIALQDFKFSEVGMYKFLIMHKSPVDPLPGIMDVGLIIRKN